MAKEIATGDIVALKKVRMDNEREGVCLSSSFELRLYNCSQECPFFQIWYALDASLM